MWDKAHTIDAISAAIQHVRSARVKVAFTLSDLFCVDRHRVAFRSLVENDLDIVFANEAEITALYETNDFDGALAQLQGKVEVGVVTRSEQGVYLVTADAIQHVPTQPVANLVDTTGAGDLFAAGFLYAYCQGHSYEEAATLGNQCAGQIIQQLGARPEEPLKALVA